MANILYNTQLSMYNKQTKEFTPAADGNINMMRNTINEWLKHRPTDKFYVLIPLTDGFYPIGKFNELKIKATPIYYSEFVVSARINRYNFPMDEFIDILCDIKYDLLINDVIEVTPNFRQMFKIELGYEPKIISNIRHVDENEESQYTYSVIDGIQKSDLVTILSESMIPKLNSQILNAGIDFVFSDMFILNKINVFEPSVSVDELLRDTLMLQHSDNVIITFPGRMSKGEEKRTNWDKFIEAINKLRKIRQDFEVYITDPNNSLNPHYIEAQEWIKTIEKDRLEFKNLLAKTDIIVSLMDVEGFGGISIREALLFNCRPVIPHVHEYRKIALENYPGFVESPIKVDDLVFSLEWAIDQGKKPNRPIYYQKGLQFSVEEQFKKLLPKIEELLKND